MKNALLRLFLVVSLCCWIVRTPAAGQQKAQGAATGTSVATPTDQKTADANKDKQGQGNSDDSSKIPTPTITGIQPVAPLNIPNQTLTLVGKDFQDKLTITLEDSQGNASDLPSDQVTYVSPTKVEATATLATSGKWKVRATNPKGAVSASYEFAVAENPKIDPNSPSVQHYAKVFAAITALLFILLVVIVVVLIVYMAKGKWSLADALSEESSSQPKEIVVSQDGQSNVVMVASTSRLIALLGLLGILTTVLGIGYAIIWNLFLYGTVPPLTQVRSFLFGAACLFAPYLANQVRAAFEPSAAPATPVAPPKPPTPAGTVTGKPTIQGQDPPDLHVKTTAIPLTLRGTGFQQPVTVALTNPTGSVINVAANDIVDVKPESVRINATLNAQGNWTVVVTNPGPNSSDPYTLAVKP